jgi:hypothetical protein
METPDKQIPAGIEVDKPVIKQGTVGWHPAGPTPKKLKDITDAIIYFCAGLGGIVGATDLFSGYQAKIMGLTLSCVILACGAVQKGIGVKPAEE